MTVLFLFMVAVFIGQLVEGELPLPYRNSGVTVTTETPFWFCVVALIWIVLLVFLGAITWVFVRAAQQPRYPS